MAIANALNSEEYRKIYEFFLIEMPPLIIKFQDLKMKVFDKFDAKLDNFRKTGDMTDRPTFDIQKAYKKASTKQSQLMKTYAANYNKLLTHACTEKSSDISTFFIAGQDIIKCCLPFKIYSKQIIANMCTLIMQYSTTNETSQILIFNSLYRLIAYYICCDDEKDDSKIKLMFELAVKKMYIEFTKECKNGGGGHSI